MIRDTSTSTTRGDAQCLATASCQSPRARTQWRVEGLLPDSMADRVHQSGTNRKGPGRGGIHGKQDECRKPEKRLESIVLPRLHEDSGL